MKRYAIANIGSGLVENIILWDGVVELSMPSGTQAIESLSAEIGCIWDGEKFIAPDIRDPGDQPSFDHKSINRSARESLLSMATLEMGPLQDAVDLGRASHEDISLLNEWKQFRVNVNEVDLSIKNPEWPSPPSGK